MSKKLTPAGVALDIAGDVVEGGLAGAGAAIGGAASGIGALAGGLASGAGSALGGALQGALTEPDVYITSYGTTGAYAKSTIKTTVNIQIPNGPQRLEATENMSLEKLMSIAIKYLSSISKNLRAQSVAENKNNEQERLANRESLIEQSNSPTPVTSDGQPRTKNKMSGMTKALLGIGALGLGAATLGKIDMSELEDLGRNIAEFQDKYGWMIELAGIASLANWILKLPGLKSLIRSGGAALARTAGSAIAGMGATGAIAMAGAAVTTLGGILAVDSFVKDSAGTALAPLQKMEKKYGIILDYDTSSGTVPVFKGATINGQKYAPGKLPKEYQEIYDSYSGARNSKSIAEVDKKYSKLKDTSEPKAESKPTVSSSSGKSSRSGVGYDSEVYQFFVSKGYPEFQAKGIAAGIKAEGGTWNTTGGYKGRAVGIGQWLGPRRDRLFSTYGRNPTHQQQLEFLHWELQGGDPGGASVLRSRTEEETLSNYIGQTGTTGKSFGFMRPLQGAQRTGDMERGMAALGRGGETYEDSNSGPMSEVKEMVVDGYKDLLKFISMAGKTDTQFRPITSKAGSWDKSAKLLNDQAKMEADMAMGRKETKLKTQLPSTSSTQLRKANGGSLDVINPNYKIGSGSILNTYIMSFSPDKKVWA